MRTLKNILKQLKQIEDKLEYSANGDKENSGFKSLYEDDCIRSFYEAKEEVSKCRAVLERYLNRNSKKR